VRLKQLAEAPGSRWRNTLDARLLAVLRLLQAMSREITSATVCDVGDEHARRGLDSLAASAEGLILEFRAVLRSLAFPFELGACPHCLTDRDALPSGHCPRCWGVREARREAGDIRDRASARAPGLARARPRSNGVARDPPVVAQRVLRDAPKRRAKRHGNQRPAVGAASARASEDARAHRVLRAPEGPVGTLPVGGPATV